MSFLFIKQQFFQFILQLLFTEPNFPPQKLFCQIHSTNKMASAVAVTILTTAAGAAITAAINQVAPTLSNLGKWDEVRQKALDNTLSAK